MKICAMNPIKLSLRIGTYNIRNTTDHYHLRKDLLQKTFDEMNCDIFGLQEISFKNYNQLNDLEKPNENPSSDIINVNKNKKNYKQYLCESQINIKRIFENKDNEYNIDGNATLSSILFEKDQNQNFYLEDHKTLHLSAERVAQMLFYKIHNSNNRFIFVNCHLHHVIEDEFIRVYQSKILCKWINLETNENDIVIVVGDFNSLPYGLAYNHFIENGFASMHDKFHGCEPEKTFHNKMDAPFKDNDPEGTFDYIFIKTPKDVELTMENDKNLRKNSNQKKEGSHIKINSVEIHGRDECLINKGIYASDHYGLCCDLEINLLNQKI